MAAANTSPIFTLTPYVGKLNLTGNIGIAASDGAGTIAATPGLYLLVTGQTNGTLISRIHIHAYATTPTNTSATVIRIYHSTQTTGVTTAANTFLICEVGFGILAAANATTALTPVDIPINYVIPATEALLVTSHSNLAANTGFQVLAIGGSY